MAAARKHLTPEQYLAREARAKERSEYVAGEVFAMVGSTPTHNKIAGNAYIALVAALKKKPCAVFMSDVKLQIAAADAFFYPDVMVSCGDTLDQSKNYVSDAQLVIEVLSPSTEKNDRAEKLIAYRKLPSLKEYVLVSQDKRQVEVYRRQDLGWLHLVFEREQVVKLESVGVKLPLRTIYEDTKVA
jgi:Uma2 family endonuclease